MRKTLKMRIFEILRLSRGYCLNNHCIQIELDVNWKQIEACKHRLYHTGAHVWAPTWAPLSHDTNVVECVALTQLWKAENTF